MLIILLLSSLQIIGSNQGRVTVKDGGEFAGGNKKETIGVRANVKSIMMLVGNERDKAASFLGISIVELNELLDGPSGNTTAKNATPKLPATTFTLPTGQVVTVEAGGRYAEGDTTESKKFELIPAGSSELQPPEAVSHSTSATPSGIVTTHPSTDPEGKIISDIAGGNNITVPAGADVVLGGRYRLAANRLDMSSLDPKDPYIMDKLLEATSLTIAKQMETLRGLKR